MTERIEANSTTIMLKTLRILGVSLIVIGTIKIVMRTNQSFTGFGVYIDSLIMITISGFLTYKSYTSEIKNRIGQFIEWDGTYIKYKLKEDKIMITIPLTEIQNVFIKLDTITIQTIDSIEYVLDISDFQEYEKRLKIKQNFERG